MPLLDSVSWRDAPPDEVAFRYPNVSLKYGSQVIVMENQQALFFRDGKALDIFGPGRHTITSNNIPLLTDALRAIGVIGAIFDCEVIFVNKSQMRANFGGRAYSAPSGSIQYQAEITFYGYTLYKVENIRLFVTEFFGNRQASTSEDIANYIRGFVMERVIDAFGKFDIHNLVRNIDETTDKIALLINDNAEQIGLNIVDTLFEGVKIPEEARRLASDMGRQTMAMQYVKETAEVLPSGEGAAAAGIGAGLGLSLGSQLTKGMQQEPSSQQVVICPSCGSQNPNSNKFCGNCGKSLLPLKTVKCPMCGTESPETTKFCGNCGETLHQ